MEKNTKTETNLQPRPINALTHWHGKEPTDVALNLTEFQAGCLHQFACDLAMGRIGGELYEFLCDYREMPQSMMWLGMDHQMFIEYEGYRDDLLQLDWCLCGTLSFEGEHGRLKGENSFALSVDTNTGEIRNVKFEDIDYGISMPQVYGETRFDLANMMWKHIEKQLGLLEPLAVFMVDEWPEESERDNCVGGIKNEVQFLISKSDLTSSQIKAIKDSIIDYWVKDFDSPEFGYASVRQFDPNEAEKQIDHCFKFMDGVERVNGFQFSPLLQSELIERGPWGDPPPPL